MAHFVDAKTAGRRFATQLMNFGNKKGQYQTIPTGTQEPIENVIFEAMQANPYKSGKARQQFIDGANDFVNESGRLQTRAMVQGN